MSGISLPGGISVGGVANSGAGIDAGDAFGGGGGPSGPRVMTIGSNAAFNERGYPNLGGDPGVLVPDTFEGETIDQLMATLTSPNIQFRFVGNVQAGGWSVIRVNWEGIATNFNLVFNGTYYDGADSGFALWSYLNGQVGNDLEVTITGVS